MKRDALSAALSALDRSILMNEQARRTSTAIREDLERLHREDPLRPSKGFRGGGAPRNGQRGGSYWPYLPAAALVLVLSAALLSCAEVESGVDARSSLRQRALAALGN